MYVAYKIALHSISIIHQAALSRSFPFSKAAGCELYGRILTYFSCKYQRLSQLVILVIPIFTFAILKAKVQIFSDTYKKNLQFNFKMRHFLEIWKF